MTTRADPLGISRTTEPGRPFSTAIFGGCVRGLDLAAVGATAVGIYLAYIYPDRGNLDSQYLASIFIVTVGAGILFQACGGYAGDYIFARNLRLGRILGAWAVTFALFLAFAFALKISAFYSRIWAVGWFISAAALLTMCRLLFSAWITRAAGAGRFANRTVIVGAGEQGQRLAAHLQESGDVRTRIIGFIDDRRTRVPASSHGHDVLGDTAHLIGLIRAGAVDQIFVALPWNAEDRLRDVLRQLTVTPVPIRLAPDLAGFGFAGRSFSEVAQLPMLHLFDRPISGWAQVAKTLEDWVLASILLIFLGPLMLLIALSIKLDSRGPVLFKQSRYGFNNNLIEVWKFRTMHARDSDPDGARQATRGDGRVTRVGRFLRRLSLDELPQFLNVLRGDMSMVGPRPHAVSTVAAGQLFEDVVGSYAARHRIKPGITGWAQVNGWRGETDTVEKIEKRVEFDLYYIDHWSVWFDLYIILKTALVIWNDRSAY